MYLCACNVLHIGYVFVISGHADTNVTEENSKTYAEFGMDLNFSRDSVT
jgi:hypothetical protein